MGYIDPRGLDRYVYALSSTMAVGVPISYKSIDNPLGTFNFLTTSFLISRITTYVVIDTDTNTISVSSLGSSGAFTAFSLKALTNAVLSIGDRAIASGLLTRRQGDNVVHSRDTVYFGDVQFGLPVGHSGMKLSVTTDTLYMISSNNGIYPTPRQFVTVPLDASTLISYTPSIPAATMPSYSSIGTSSHGGGYNPQPTTPSASTTNPGYVSTAVAASQPQAQGSPLPSPSQPAAQDQPSTDFQPRGWDGGADFTPTSPASNAGTSSTAGADDAGGSAASTDSEGTGTAAGTGGEF